jgi:hypothetical protein
MKAKKYPAVHVGGIGTSDFQQTNRTDSSIFDRESGVNVTLLAGAN